MNEQYIAREAKEHTLHVQTSFFEYGYESPGIGIRMTDCSKLLQDLSEFKPWIDRRDFYFAEYALKMRSP